MYKALSVTALLMVGTAGPVSAQADIPDLTGAWTCDPAPLLIRGEWTTLTYTYEVRDQKDGLFVADMVWDLPPAESVARRISRL